MLTQLCRAECTVLLEFTVHVGTVKCAHSMLCDFLHDPVILDVWPSYHFQYFKFGIRYMSINSGSVWSFGYSWSLYIVGAELIPRVH